MKKSNLLKATLFGILSAILAVIPMVFLYSSTGLLLTFFATISAVICVTELGVPIRSYLLWAIALHFGYLLMTVMPGVTVTDYKTGIVCCGIVSMIVLFSGLTISVVKVKKLQKNSSVNFLLLLGCISIMTSCGTKTKEQPKSFRVSYFGTKAVVTSHDAKWHIVETYKTTALTDSTVGQKTFLMFLSDEDYKSMVGRLQNDQRDFSITASNFVTSIRDTVYIPLGGVNQIPYYVVGNLAEYGKEISTHFRGKSNQTGFSCVSIETLTEKVGAVIRNDYLQYTNVGCLMIAENPTGKGGFIYYNQTFPIVNHADFHGYPQGWFGGW